MIILFQRGLDLNENLKQAKIRKKYLKKTDHIPMKSRRPPEHLPAVRRAGWSIGMKESSGTGQQIQRV